MREKKAVFGPIISVFVLVLIVSILAGLTFLFVAGLKNTIQDATDNNPITVINESIKGSTVASGNSTGYLVSNSSALGFNSPSIIAAINSSSGGTAIITGNLTIGSDGTITNSTAASYNKINVTYSYNYIAQASAFNSINATEAAGSSTTNYLSLIFLAVIFGAILTLVLRIILPYMNLGSQFGGF